MGPSQPAERSQARLFAAILRRDLITMERKVEKAEFAWKRRCEADGYVDPPERLAVVKGRIAEANRMLAALNSRFPNIG
jgi:hypothetical protein